MKEFKVVEMGWGLQWLVLGVKIYSAPRVLLKLDLARAFDTVSWPFLFEVLQRHGFSDQFIEWLAILLSTASTRVLINGEPGPPI